MIPPFKEIETKRLLLREINPEITTFIVQNLNHTPQRGYHETVTLFWAWVLKNYLKSQNLDKGIETLAVDFLASPFADKHLPFQFYSKAYLLSTKARGIWVEPDKKVLTFSAIYPSK